MEKERSTLHISKIKVVENTRFIQDGKILTTGGITSGIDAALYVVEMISGIQTADQVAQLLVCNRHDDLSFMNHQQNTL